MTQSHPSRYCSLMKIYDNLHDLNFETLSYYEIKDIYESAKYVNKKYNKDQDVVSVCETIMKYMSDMYVKKYIVNTIIILQNNNYFKNA